MIYGKRISERDKGRGEENGWLGRKEANAPSFPQSYHSSLKLKFSLS